MAASSNPPPSSRAALTTTPYASLAPRPPTTSQSPTPPAASPSLAPKDGKESSARRTNPTWSDASKGPNRVCKTHNLARRPNGTCMACEREKKEARGSSRVIVLAVLLLAVGVGGAWFVSQQNQVTVSGATTAP